MQYNLKKIALTMTLLYTANSHAALNCNYSYGIATSVNGTAGHNLCMNDAEQFIDLVKNLKNANPNYNDTAAAEIEGRFNDVDMTLNYAENSNTLTFNSTDLNITNKTFSGSTRKDAQKEFTDWLKKSGVIGEIMQYQSKNTAVSPITGVGGIMPTLATTDFNTELNSVSKTSSTDTQNLTSNLLGVGLSGGSYSVKGSAENVDTLTLPLSYSFNTKNDSGQKLLISAPITMYTVGNAKGYHAGLGVGYRIPINKQWSITPNVRYTLSGSVDRATVASVLSGSLTSMYTMPVGKFDVSFGNMIGYYKTGKFKVGDYSFDPKIKQTMLRNGVMLSQPFTVKGKKLAAEYSIIDTRYVGGNKPFLRTMQEYGVTVGFHKDAPKTKLSALRVGVNYMHAKNAKGFMANVGYWF